MSNSVICVENLSKKYIIGHQKEQGYATMREAIAGGARKLSQRILHPLKSAHGTASNSEEFWALKDISFDVKQGERLGIIGRNGAGKSTLLKILSRITEPTSGRVTIKGRVSSLLEVGTGFHPELTGRENVSLNGAILGMGRQEIQRKFDEIVDFSGVEKFIDTPVKRYSSGMKVRLAFAVAAHLEPEILLVDEVLAVGDVEFQKKCLGKMENITQEGRTVVFVSHQMAAIENLCDRTILLVGGRIESDGNTSKVIKNYLENVVELSVTQTPLSNRNERSGNGQVQFTSFHMEDSEGNPLQSIQNGKDVFFVFGYKANEFPIRKLDVGFSIHSTKNNQLLLVLYSSYQGHIFNIDSQKGYIKCRIAHLPLSKGRYRVGGRLTVNSIEADWLYDGIGFIDVIEGDFYGTGRLGFDSNAPFLMLGEWCLD